VLSWNGTRWKAVASPNPSGDDALSSVACGLTSCVAVGSSQLLVAGALVDRTLIETWQGSAWVVAPSPNQARSSNRLVAVSSVSGASTAVGSYAARIGTRSLIESRP
jgi:hypothetical protein